MNQQAPKYSFRWWSVALPVLIGILYLGASHIKNMDISRPHPGEAISSGEPRTETLVTPAPRPMLPAVFEPQSQPQVKHLDPKKEAPTPSLPEVNSLTPEVAREAVHAVETSVYTRASQLFEQEAIDVEWAAAYENSLHAMFAQHHGLQRVSINSINCHTTMCRIEVFTPRDTDADFFTAMFYDGLENHAEGTFKSEAAIARNMENGLTSVYVARKGHTLGFY